MRLGALYGRETPVRAAAAALAAPGSLVTITGLAGSGRTSVALEAVRSLGDPGSFALVDGRSATGPGELSAALQGRGPTEDLLVDDADHAHSAVRELRDLRRVRPELRLLLTSSKPLGLPGEVVVRLSALPLPDLDADPSTLLDNPAVRLFLDVSASTGTESDPGPSTITAVARICHLLGGLPLAIRLVAARTATYSPATLAALMSRTPGRLLRTREGTPAHEHDLVKAVAWSVSLLQREEGTLLRDLTVFRSPVSVDVLDTVCGGDGLIDELSTLVDAHLVDPRHEGSQSRFSLPPLVREHLAGPEGRSPPREVRDRHRLWALDLAQRSVRLDAAGRLLAARQVVGAHEPDLMAALADALAVRDGAAATTLALALVPLAFSRGTTPEICRLIDDVLALVGGGTAGEQAPTSADRLVLAAWAELLRAETAESLSVVETTVPALALLRDEARQVDDRTLLRLTYVAVQAARSLVRRGIPEEWAEEGRALAVRLDDQARLVRLETWTGMLAHQRGDIAEAERWAWSALRRARTLDDPSLALAPAGLLHGLPRPPTETTAGRPPTPTGTTAGRPPTPTGTTAGRDDPLPSPDQLVTMARECGDLRALDWLEPTAAYADLSTGDLAGACDHSAATLRRVRTSGARPRAGASILCLFLVALQRGDVVWAGRLHGMLGRYLDVLRPALPPSAAAAYDRAVEAYRAASAGHDDATSDVMWGVQLSWDDGIDAALGYAAHARRASVARSSHQSEHTAARPSYQPAHTAGRPHHDPDHTAARASHQPDHHAHRDTDHAALDDPDRNAAGTSPRVDHPEHTAASTRHRQDHPDHTTTGTHDRVDHPDHATLTERELDVMGRLVAGGTNREISRELGISPKTVMHHTSSIYRKLGVRGRAEAVAWFLRMDVEDPPDQPRLHLVEGGSGSR